MTKTRKAVRAMLACALVSLLATLPTVAQQDSSHASKDEAPKAAGSAAPGVAVEPTPEDQNSAPLPSGPPDPYAGTIKDVGTGLPLLGTSNTPLKWGPFSINAFDFIGVHDNFDLPNSPNSIDSNLFFFRVGLMFDHYLWKDKSRLVLQYLPQAAIADGHFHANAAMNNNVSLGTKFLLTPRLSFTVGDLFVQTQSNPLIPLNYLSADANSGSVVQNNFLDTNGSFISNTVNGVFEYAVSPRTNVTFAPLYRYGRSTNSLPNYEANGQTYAGVFTLGHAFTPHRTVGIVDTIQYVKESTSTAPQNVTYNTIGAFYSEQLARTFWISGNVGAVNQSGSSLAGASGWGVNANVSLLKSLTPRISLTLGYTRGMNFSNYVTLRRSDRVDASAGYKLTSRMSWNNSFGYYSELGANPRTNAKYAESDLAYRFIGGFNFFTTFAYTFQNSSTVQLFSGNRKTLAYGVRWSPANLRR
jgi:hypothetical protein